MPPAITSTRPIAMIDEVDVAEPRQLRGDPSRSRPQRRLGDEEDADDEVHEGAGGRHPELGAGRRELACDLGHAAEEPQRDPLDLHPSRRAWIACPSSCRIRQAKNAAVAVSPMAAYACQLRPGRASGNWTGESDHRISPKTTSQLQLRPTRRPPEHDGRPHSDDTIAPRQGLS